MQTLELHETEPQLHWSPGESRAVEARQAGARAIMFSRSGAGAVSQELARQLEAPRLLMQPDAPVNLVIPQVPLPTVVMWSPQVNLAKIAPPPPEKAVTANVRPSLSAMNHERNVADIDLSSNSAISATLPLTASTTTPIAVHGVELPKVPQTSSSLGETAAPTTVLSISDRAVQGTIALPFANAIAGGSAEKGLMAGPSNNSPATGGVPGQQKGNGSDRAANGQGRVAGGQDGPGGGQDKMAGGPDHGAASGQPGTSGGNAGSNSGTDNGTPSGNELTVERIVRPKDGRFGMVVVGGSLAEDHAETAGLWSDRLAYTVYMHVGGPKNWILQFSLPRSADETANNSRPDAPWPYLIVRPNLAADDFDADGIMVHGFIDTAGRFQQLAVVFPPQFAQTKFVLRSLEQWQFRPAMQNGELTRVEVLLIIPDGAE